MPYKTKKPADDSRDIFEKALDVAADNPEAVGFGGAALVGAAGGRALARRLAKRDNPSKRYVNWTGRAGAGLGAAAGAQTLGGLGTIATMAATEDRRKKKNRRK